MSNVVGYNLNKGYLAKYGILELALAGAGVAMIPALPTPAYLSAASATVAGSLGVKHLLLFVRNRRERERLNMGVFFSVAPGQVTRFRERAVQRGNDNPSGALADYYYLGNGFPWTPRHMALYEILKNNHEFIDFSNRLFAEEGRPRALSKELLDTLAQRKQAGGRPYIHNIGLEEAGPQVLHLKEHTLVAGESGSGKTVLLNLLSAQFIRDGEALCIIDPKGDKDLLNSVYSQCVDAGREEDFLFFSISHPGKSISFDPMANSLRSGDAANRITSILEVGGTKAFVDFCQDVLNTVAEALINVNLPVNLKNLFKYSLLDAAELLKMCRITLKRITDPTQRMALEEAIPRLELLVNHPGEHFSKMITSLKPPLTALATGEVGMLLNPSSGGYTWESVIKGKKVIYFNLASMVDNFTASAASKLIVQDLISYIGQMYAYDKAISPIKLICDEFYSIAYKGFGDALNKSRAAGLQAFLGLQTDSDIAAQLDRDMVDVMLGNLPNKIYLRIGQQHLAEKFTMLFPEANLAEIQKMRSTSATPTDDEIMFRSSTAERVQLKAQTIVTPEMVMGLPQGQAFVYNKGGAYQVAIPRLHVAHRVNYFDDVLNKDFSLSVGQRVAVADHFRKAGRQAWGA
jgi:conjugal transfer pilus assembly protein TraD